MSIIVEDVITVLEHVIKEPCKMQTLIEIFSDPKKVTLACLELSGTIVQYVFITC